MKERLESIAKILELKQKLLDKSVLELQILENEENSLRADIINFQEKLFALNIAIGAEADIDDFVMIESGRHYFELKINNLNIRLKKLLVKKQNKKEEIIKMNQEVKGIEKIYEKRKKLMEHELQLKERRELDDMVSARRRV